MSSPSKLHVRSKYQTGPMLDLNHGRTGSNGRSGPVLITALSYISERDVFGLLIRTNDKERVQGTYKHGVRKIVGGIWKTKWHRLVYHFELGAFFPFPSPLGLFIFFSPTRKKWIMGCEFLWDHGSSIEKFNWLFVCLHVKKNEVFF